MMQRRRFSREFKLEAVSWCGNAKLKAERDILKKAAAYFARDSI